MLTRESSMDSAYLILAGLCLIGLMIRNGYELLKKRGEWMSRTRRSSS